MRLITGIQVEFTHATKHQCVFFFVGLEIVCLCAFYLLTWYEMSKHLKLSLNVLACNVDDLVFEEFFCLNLLFLVV